jgi:hypothetical protein
MLPLLPLPPNECPNIGGVRALRVWPAGNVRIPAYVGASLNEPLVLLDPNNYADIWFLPDTGGFEEPEQPDAQGEFYKPSLQLAIAKDAPGIQEAIGRLRAVRHFVVAYRDANGLTKLVGTPDFPLRLTAGLETGKRPLDRNGYPLVFTGACPTPAPAYLALPVLTPTGRGAFSAGFSFGFD